MEDSNTLASLRPVPRTADRCPYLMVIAGHSVGELHKLTGERTVVGRGPAAALRLDDDGISREHAELVVVGGRVRVKDLGSTNGTFLNGEPADARELRDGDKLSIGAATLLVFTDDDGLERRFASGRSRAAMRDAATSALKREVFIERLAEELSYLRRRAAPVALLVWAVDGFPAAEDRHGPAATRQLVAAVARRVRGVLSEDDLFGAMGPGRFAVACPEANAEEARDSARALRAIVAEAPVDIGTSRVAVTVSVGVALGGPRSDRTATAARALVQAAESAAATAAARGGDAVELAAP